MLAGASVAFLASGVSAGLFICIAAGISPRFSISGGLSIVSQRDGLPNTGTGSGSIPGFAGVEAMVRPDRRGRSMDGNGPFNPHAPSSNPAFRPLKTAGIAAPARSLT